MLSMLASRVVKRAAAATCVGMRMRHAARSRGSAALSVCTIRVSS